MKATLEMRDDGGSHLVTMHRYRDTFSARRLTPLFPFLLSPPARHRLSVAGFLLFSDTISYAKHHYSTHLNPAHFSP